MSPAISIIMSTYNRSNILGFAIETVRWQTHTDWELLVIGDACTDDTPAVVASFNDPRIRFINLPENCGEQTGPNNHGLSLARGQYLAFLNHDDLWLPDHLQGALAHLQQHNADLVFSLNDIIDTDGARRAGGYAHSDRFNPSFEALASSWLFRRSLLDRVGPWRFARQCYIVPSQDWLYRAWRKRAALLAWPTLSVVALQSGTRRNSYRDRQHEEHQRLFNEIRADYHAFRAREMQLLAPDIAGRSRPPVFGNRLLMALGLHPQIIRQWRKGDFARGKKIQALRTLRGLPPLPK